MGIRFSCPNGHKLNVKTFLAGKRGVCPQCGEKFIIPAPAEVETSESLPSGIAGQSHTVEIVSPSPHKATTVAASPSIIIAVAETDASIRQIEPAADGVRAPEVLRADVPPASLAAASEPLIENQPAAAISETPIIARRERSRRNQLAISIVLLALVIVLAVVLIWVLKRDVGPPSGGRAATTDARGLQPLATIVALN